MLSRKDKKVSWLPRTANPTACCGICKDFQAWRTAQLLRSVSGLHTWKSLSLKWVWPLYRAERHEECHIHTLWDVGVHGQSAGTCALGVLSLLVHVLLTVWCERRGSHHLSIHITPCLPWGSWLQPLGVSPVAPGGARGLPSGVLAPQEPGPSPSGWKRAADRARSELTLSLLSHTSFGYSCFSGLENPGRPTPCSGNSWTAAGHRTLESNWSQTVPRTKWPNPFLSTEIKMLRAYFKRC